MSKEKVLENIRKIRLSKKDKIEVCKRYDSVTSKQNTDFEMWISEYEGIVRISFKDVLYDKYIYALNAYDTNGISMVDYLLTQNGFINKHAPSFKI